MATPDLAEDERRLRDLVTEAHGAAKDLRAALWEARQEIRSEVHTRVAAELAAVNAQAPGLIGEAREVLGHLRDALGAARREIETTVDKRSGRS